MKKLLSLITIIALLIGINIQSCPHVHDDDCGYDEATQTGCTHKCGDECSNINPAYTYPPEDGLG